MALIANTHTGYVIITVHIDITLRLELLGPIHFLARFIIHSSSAMLTCIHKSTHNHSTWNFRKVKNCGGKEQEWGPTSKSSGMKNASCAACTRQYKSRIFMFMKIHIVYRYNMITLSTISPKYKPTVIRTPMKGLPCPAAVSTGSLKKSPSTHWHSGSAKSLAHSVFFSQL